MDLIPYVARLQRDLVAATDRGDDEGQAVAERLADVVESSLRLVLLDALVEASGEITQALGPGAVEVRLRGHEVGFAVSAPTPVEVAAGPPGGPVAAAGERPDGPDDAEDGGTARISLRMPERLKPRVEEAAEAAGLSVNAWLVRSITTLVEGRPAPPPSTTWAGTGQRHTGWAR